MAAQHACPSALLGKGVIERATAMTGQQAVHHVCNILLAGGKGVDLDLCAVGRVEQAKIAADLGLLQVVAQIRSMALTLGRVGIQIVLQHLFQLQCQLPQFGFAQGSRRKGLTA